ncbi:MAG: glycosyltransferase [Planctomycetota bacterium]
MKIWQVLHGFPPELSGGTERTVEALARAMQGRGHDLRVVCGSIAPGDALEPLHSEFEGLSITRLGREDLDFESWEKAYSPRVSDGFRALIRSERPDVVHVHHWIRLSTDLCRIAKAEGVPVVAVHLHDYWTQQASPVRRADTTVPTPPAAPPWMNSAERREAFALHRRDLTCEVRAADLRFAPCRAHADGVQEFAERDLGPIEVSNPALLDVPARRPTRTGPRRKLLFFGSVYPEKGLITVLEAMHIAEERYSLIVLGAAHDEAYRARLEGLSQGLDVRFAGAFSTGDLQSVEADLMVLPSLCHESYGLVLDEARALGFPVLASDLPSLREHADPNATRWFEPGSAKSLAALLNDPDDLDSMSEPVQPELVSAAESADALLERYEAARRGEIDRAADDGVAELDDHTRLRAMFRRAERRLWSSLQNGQPTPPPDEFLGPDSRETC